MRLFGNHRGVGGGPARGVPPRARVLVVDDEPSICRALSIALTRAGYEAKWTQSGEGAHSLLGSERFDILVLDLRIPDVRGDVLYHLAVSLQPHLRGHTLFITGDVTDRAQVLIADCECPLLQKPFRLEDVLASVGAMEPPHEAEESA